MLSSTYIKSTVTVWNFLKTLYSETYHVSTSEILEWQLEQTRTNAQIRFSVGMSLWGVSVAVHLLQHFYPAEQIALVSSAALALLYIFLDLLVVLCWDRRQLQFSPLDLLVIFLQVTCIGQSTWFRILIACWKNIYNHNKRNFLLRLRFPYFLGSVFEQKSVEKCRIV